MRRKRWNLRIPWKHIQNVLLAAFVASFTVYFWPAEKNNNVWLIPLTFLERAGYDALFAVRGESPERVDQRIEIVGFDYQSTRDLNSRWPPPRHDHADVIRNLAKDGARLIVYDVLFSGGTDPKDDKALDEALKDAGNVILTSRIDRDFVQLSKTLEEPHYDDSLGVDFLAKAKVGFAEVPTDADDIVRRFVPCMQFREQWMPSLATAAYLALLEKPDTDITLTDEEIVIGGVGVPRTGPTVVDVVDKGPIPSAYVDFPAGGGSFPITRFSQVALGKFKPGTFKDKVVFVGLVDTQDTRAIRDEYITSFSRFLPGLTGTAGIGRVPGVVLQAQNFNALLAGGYVTHLPDWSLWTILFVITLTGASAVRRYYNWRGPFVLVLFVAGYLTYALLAFSYFSIHMPYVVPCGLMFGSISFVAYLERGSLRRKWSGYVSPEVLEQILRNETDEIARNVEATVLFGDIRGFTAFANRQKPETVVKLLNMHFEKMNEIIYQEHGTIDKFLGDGIMALFGTPIPRKDSAVCAVRAAWRMCVSSKEPLFLDGEQHFLQSGFGVTTGRLVAGHVGSKSRHDFTVIGDVVNMAARLQGVTNDADVVIDRATYDVVREHITVKSLGRVAVKGAFEPIECFKVESLVELSPKASKVMLRLRRKHVEIPAAEAPVSLD